MKSGIKSFFAIAAAMFICFSRYAENAAAAQGGSAQDERYDPGTEYSSPVHDQWDWGTCWAMSGISTAESFLIKEQLADSHIFLSAEDMLWWARGNEHGGWNYQCRGDGGYPPMAAGYLTTAGVRSNEAIPYLMEPSDGDYYGSLFFETGENQKPANYDTAPVLYEVTDLEFVKVPASQEIKNLIVKYGAVAACCYDSAKGLDPETGAYWHPFQEGLLINHSVSVVGWDDNYPKENFRCVLKEKMKDENGEDVVDEDGEPLYEEVIAVPGHDGAWIVKNSFGTDNALGGYNYISYDDGYLFTSDHDLMYVYCVTGARKPLEQKRYLHDQFGAVSFWERKSGTTVWANVFDFGSRERISELSFVSWTKGGKYQLYYAPMNGSVPSADPSEWILLSEGIIDHAGYTTVPSSLDKNVPEGKGAILLSVTGDAPSIGTDEPLAIGGRPVFDPIKDDGTAFILGRSGFMPARAKRTDDAGNETETGVDLCIRAYTVPGKPDGTKGPDKKPGADQRPGA